VLRPPPEGPAPRLPHPAKAASPFEGDRQCLLSDRVEREALPAPSLCLRRLRPTLRDGDAGFVPVRGMASWPRPWQRHRAPPALVPLRCGQQVAWGPQSRAVLGQLRLAGVELAQVVSVFHLSPRHSGGSAQGGVAHRGRRVPRQWRSNAAAAPWLRPVRSLTARGISHELAISCAPSKSTHRSAKASGFSLAAAGDWPSARHRLLESPRSRRLVLVGAAIHHAITRYNHRKAISQHCEAWGRIGPRQKSLRKLGFGAGLPSISQIRAYALREST